MGKEEARDLPRGSFKLMVCNECELCNGSGVFFEQVGETIMELGEVMHYCPCAKGQEFKAIAAQKIEASPQKAVMFKSGRDKRLGQNN